MVDNITSLQTQYLMEQERVRMDKEQHDDYTKTGLRHLVNSARIQLKLASITTGDVAAQHRALANNIIRSTHADMVRLGLIRIPEQIADLTNSVGTTNSPAMSHQDLEEVQHNDEDKSDPYKELQELIGLDAAKKAIKKILDKGELDKLRPDFQIPTEPVPLHMVFTGNPGTGKTTIARLIAKIYKQMGVLEKGHLVEVHARDLVAEHVGQTAPKTKKIIESAIGGVLFLDEAYALSRGGENDFGKEAIDTLLKEMEDKRESFAVIVAGYVDEMRVFINSNSGLSSRFKHFIPFEDYSPEEMYDIFVSMMKKTEDVLTDEAQISLKEILKAKSIDVSFGNARGVRNLYDEARIVRDSRIYSMIKSGTQVTRSLLTTLEKEDIDEAAKTINSSLIP